MPTSLDAKATTNRALTLLRDTIWLLADVDQRETAAGLVQIAEIYLDGGHPVPAGVLASAAARLVGGSGVGWDDRQRKRSAEVLERSGGDADGTRPIKEVVGVALHV